jgi:hypothetical protein
MAAYGQDSLDPGNLEKKKIAVLFMPGLLALKAEALYLADRASEALEAIRKAETFVERSEGRCWCAELYRLRGVFLTASGTEETQIEASFCEAVRIAKEQKSISPAKRPRRVSRNTVVKRRAGHEDIYSAYLFGKSLSLSPSPGLVQWSNRPLKA